MAKHFDVRWHAPSQCWRSDVGDVYTDKKGNVRRKTMSFKYPDGRKIPKSDKGAALTALARRLEEIKPKPSGGLALAQVSEHFLLSFENRVAKDLASERTYRDYVNHLSIASAELGEDVPADQVRAEDLQGIVDRWISEGKSPSYCNLLIASVSACFSWAARAIPGRGKDADGKDLPEKLIPANPFAKFPRIPVPQSEVKYADRKEVARYLRWVWGEIHKDKDKPGRRVRRDRPRDYWHRQTVLAIRLCLWTGCRPSEACRALWEWVDWEAGTLTIPPKRHKTGRKTGKARRIYIPPILLRALRRVHEGPVRHPIHLFAHRHGRDGTKSGDSTTGKPWHSEALTKRIQVWRDRAIQEGVPLRREGADRWHLYRLRHTRASDGLMQGHSSATVAEVLGSSEEMIRRTYGHLLDGHTAAAARSMGRAKPTNRESGPTA